MLSFKLQLDQKGRKIFCVTYESQPLGEEQYQKKCENNLFDFVNCNDTQM